MSRICCGGETPGRTALKHARSEAAQGRMQVQLVRPLREQGSKAIYTGDSGEEEEGDLLSCMSGIQIFLSWFD